MSIQLKIKAKALAAEASIIRKEEQKQIGYARYCRRTNHADPLQPTMTFDSLREHRLNVVRPAARTTGLARAFIKGQKYAQVEKPVRSPLSVSDVKNILAMVNKYGTSPQTIENLLDWIEVPSQ